MFNSFKVISLSHANAPLELREQFAITADQSQNFLDTIKTVVGLEECMVLSTCNRTEVYFQGSKTDLLTIQKLLCIEKGIAFSDEVAEQFELIIEHIDAVRHLFEVALGLKSKVLGDLQIINQVKKAYQLSADQGFAGPFLHRILHTIFYANKKVCQETAFRDGAASVSYATEEQIEQMTVALDTVKVMVVGLGEIGSDLVRNISQKERYQVIIANRTEEKSISLAKECNVSHLAFEKVLEEVKEVDVLVSAIQKDTYHFLPKHFTSTEKLKYQYLIDLSIPRSIDPKIEDHAGILLFNLDQIESQTNEVLAARQRARLDVIEILDASIVDFMDWSKEMIVSPTINKLKNALEVIRKEEIDRYIKNLDQDQINLMDQVTKSMVQKIIKLPVLQLKAACKRGEAETLIDVLNDLFDLEKTPTKI